MTVPGGVAARDSDVVARDSVGQAPPAQRDTVFVDLDGTILKTDLLWESFFAAFKTDPRILLKIPGWLLEGRARLKVELSRAGLVDVRTLPFREDVLELLKARRLEGGRVVLATAAARASAEDVAQELQVFDDVLATTGSVNLKGERKLAAIKDYCSAHGIERFTYVGDSTADLAIWTEAETAYAVSPGKNLSARLAARHPRAQVIGTPRRLIKSVCRAMRPKQWAKNVLVFVPLIMSHQILEWHKCLSALLAFVAFSLCASGIYVLNDLMDIRADRAHPDKRRRPFAAGDIPLQYGVPLFASLTVCGFGVAMLLPSVFSAILFVYLGLTCAYTYRAKGIVAVDVIMLACLYAIRVIAGGLATDVEVSQWLIAFSMFLFLSLAFAKRHSELMRLRSTGQSEAKGRAYGVHDISLVQSLGPTSGYLAVLVLALYVNSAPMQLVYSNPWPLWAICPLLLYWISRLWFLSSRGELSEDPVAFALSDPISLALGVFTMFFLIAATFIPRTF